MSEMKAYNFLNPRQKAIHIYIYNASKTRVPSCCSGAVVKV